MKLVPEPSGKPAARGWLSVVAGLCLFACQDPGELRAEWFRRLIQRGEHVHALEVFEGLGPEQRERATLRHQALLATLGRHGFGSALVTRIGRIWALEPQALYREPGLAGADPSVWAEVLAEAEELSRAEDEEGVRRMNAGVRYTASVILLRDALSRGGDSGRALAAFRRALEDAATLRFDPRGRLAKLNQTARANAERFRREVSELDDAALVAWLSGDKKP